SRPSAESEAPPGAAANRTPLVRGASAARRRARPVDLARERRPELLDAETARVLDARPRIDRSVVERRDRFDQAVDPVRPEAAGHPVDDGLERPAGAEGDHRTASRLRLDRGDPELLDRGHAERAAAR